MEHEEQVNLPILSWMPSRIPMRDALVAFVPAGVKLAEGVIPSCYEQRWYPQQDNTLRLLVLYSGGDFDSSLFHIEPKAWDHTTCDLCVTRIPAMTVCYVTKFDPYVGLCSGCYRKYIVHKVNVGRLVLWYVKRMLGVYAAA